MAVSSSAGDGEAASGPHRGRGTLTPAALSAFLAAHPPFDLMPAEALAAISEAARVLDYGPGDLVLDAFSDRTVELFVVVSGRIDVWNDADHVTGRADETLGPGEVFGFSAMLTERSVGPRAVAATDAQVARIPADIAVPAFATRQGARFLAEIVAASMRREPTVPTYSLVDDLIPSPPIVVEAGTSLAEAARLMTERGVGCVTVALPAGGFGLITDDLLRRRVIVDGMPAATAAEHAIVGPAPTVLLGDSAVEALIALLDSEAAYLLVTDRLGTPRGVIEARDFAISPTTAGVSQHEQLRRAASIDELDQRAREVPALLGDLLSRGLSSSKVIAVYSSMLDTVVRRTIALTFQRHPDLSVDAFTWLSLGSNGRREAVLSSDVDSAVALSDSLSDEELGRYRAAFAEVDAVLATAGLSGDTHGATAQHPAFSRRHREWRAAGVEWMAAPEQNEGAIMASLLVDGRPIHGDPGLPDVMKIFHDLRRHPGTMRLLLEESLAKRAKLHAFRDVLLRRVDTFDIKHHALLPIVNMARWAALSVGSSVLPTTERLRVASGSAILPAERASTLIEVFGVLQRLRLRYQLLQLQQGERPTDLLALDRVSPIDRSVIAQAVREISAAQRRMDNVSAYVPVEAWTAPESG